MPSKQDATHRAIRTLLQLVAGGGTTALIDALVVSLTPSQQAIVTAVNVLVISFAQNWLEDHDKIPTLLKD